MQVSNQNYDVTNFDQCPVKDTERKRTDCFCTICTSIFALIMFIIACATFNRYNLQKMTYFTDGVGNVCGFDLVDFPIAYYTSPQDSTKRLCVSQCPKTGDKSLKCHPTQKLACGANTNPEFEVQIYDSAPVNNRIGYICMPTDPTLHDKIAQISGVQGKYYFLTIYDSIWTSLWISIVFGIILIILMQIMSRKIFHWMFILGSLSFIALGITIFIVPHGFILFKIVGGLLFILMGLLVGLSILKKDYRAQIFVGARLFQVAALIVKERWIILVYILIWNILQVGLIALISFQMLSAWSIGPLHFYPDHSFYEVGSFISNFLSFWIFVEFIWGLSFLKESFNFCVGGYATQWYCHRQNNPGQIGLFHSLKILLKYHWGSVAGGSLMLWLFYFIDLFVDFFFSNDKYLDKGKVPARVFNRTTVQHRGCASFFDLVRSQSFAYINLIPIPYCNASRYCQMLAEDSSFYDRSQTTNRLYRLSAHIVIIMIATLIAFAANQHTQANPNIVGVFFVAIVSLFSCTYFIAMHGDLAEGILVSIFVEERLNGLNYGVNEIGEIAPSDLLRPPPIAQVLYYDDLKNIYHDTDMLDYLKAHKKGQTSTEMRLSQFNQSNTNTNPMATQPYSQPYSQTNPQAYQAY